MSAWDVLAAAPGDLSAARVWADALTEKGDPQGEAITLRCALEEAAPEDPRRDELQRKAERLEARHGRVWLHRHWGGVATRELRPGLFRGLPFLLSGNLAPILTAQHLALHPVAALDAQWAHPQELNAIAAMPELTRIVDLALQQYWGELDLAGLFSSPHLGPIVRLALVGRREGWAGETTLELLRRLTGLRALTLKGCVLTDAKLAALTAAMPALAELRVDVSELTPAGITALLDGPGTLHTLGITGAGFGPKHLEALAAHPKAAALRVLELDGATLGKKGGALVGSLGALHTLSLTGIEGPKPDWAALCTPSLRVLSLAGNALREEGAGALRGAQLESLNLHSCYLGDAGAAALAKSKGFGALKTLNLAGNSIKKEGLPALAKAPWLATVETLNLAHNHFGTDGGKALAKSKHLGALRKLVLGHNWLGVLGMRALLANPALAGLEEIRSGENNFGAEVLSSFVKAKTPLGLTHLRAPQAKKADLLKLAAMPQAAQLVELELYGHEFDDEVAAAFVASPHVKDVGLLALGSANLTPKSRAALADRFGPRLSV